MVRIGGMRSRTTLPSKDIESLGIMQSLLIDRAINGIELPDYGQRTI